MGSLQRLPSGSELYTETHGEGPTLLCIHGLGGGAYFYTALGMALRKRVHTVALDLPGYGFSPRDPAGFSFERNAERIVELARAIAPTQPIVLMGHSLGVMLALKAYALAPELFSKLIFVSGIPAVTDASKQSLLFSARYIRESGTMRGFGAMMLPQLISAESSRSMAGMLGAIQRLIEINDPIVYAETCEALAAVNTTDLADKVHIPCCLIAGSDDDYAPRDALREFAEKILAQKSLVEIPKCGHFPFFEKPTEFHAAVREFVCDGK